MGEALLFPGGFDIADLTHDPALQERLLALENGQTRELIVNGVRGWWVRGGGEHHENAFMSPSTRTRAALQTSDERQGRQPAQVQEPNDALVDAAFFSPLPPYEQASPSQRSEGGRRLLALTDLGWRSSSRWYSDRDDLHER